jgi:hypothetical protein
LYAYTPTADDGQLLQALYAKIDELALEDPEAIDPLYTRISGIYQEKLGLDSYPDRKLYMLYELETYLKESYIDKLTV